MFAWAENAKSGGCSTHFPQPAYPAEEKILQKRLQMHPRRDVCAVEKSHSRLMIIAINLQAKIL
jgi:hypothetical protein